MDSAAAIVAASLVVGAAIALIFFGNYFRKRRSEVVSLAAADLQPQHKNPMKPPQPAARKIHARSNAHGADKVPIASFCAVLEASFSAAE